MLSADAAAAAAIEEQWLNEPVPAAPKGNIVLAWSAGDVCDIDTEDGVEFEGLYTSNSSVGCL